MTRAEEIRRLRQLCMNCGEAFGFHGAAKPHNCPRGETNFQPTAPGTVPPVPSQVTEKFK